AEEVMASDSPVNEAGWAEAGATEPPAHHLSAGTCRRRLAPDDPRQRETRHRREAASRKPGRALPRRDRVLVGGRGDPSSRSATYAGACQTGTAPPTRCATGRDAAALNQIREPCDRTRRRGA